ncbi:hypothetical protein ACJX0J_035177 [Zea mays]
MQYVDEHNNLFQLINQKTLHTTNIKTFQCRTNITHKIYIKTFQLIQQNTLVFLQIILRHFNKLLLQLLEVDQSKLDIVGVTQFKRLFYNGLDNEPVPNTSAIYINAICMTHFRVHMIDKMNMTD